MPLIGLWKMLDNLRRSLSAPASLLALLVGLDAAAATSPCRGAHSCCSRSRCPTLLPLVRGGVAAALDGHAAQPSARAAPRRRRSPSAQTALLASMLGYQAWLMADAIGRTLWRMCGQPPAPARMDSGRPALEHRAPTSAASTSAWAAASCSRSPRPWSSRSMNGGRLPGIALPFLMLWLAAPVDRVAHQPHADRAVAQVRPVVRASSASCG